MLEPELATDNAFRTRFRLEAQAASRMAHPTIVRVYDAGEDTETEPDGTVRAVPYIVMEFVSGRLLKDIIAAGPVPADDAVRYIDGILEALEYSHRAGVVHRDIKPGNVLVTDAGQVKVMDFGIARAVSDCSSTVAETTAILGTAAYFSPEQAKGEPVDARADLYSTGVVLYELLAGRPPFRGESRSRSPTSTSAKHRCRRPRSTSRCRDRSMPWRSERSRRIRSSATRMRRPSARRSTRRSTAARRRSARSARSPASCTAPIPARRRRLPGRCAS